jgi:hypothetical protein
MTAGLRLHRTSDKAFATKFLKNSLKMWKNKRA